MEATFVNYTPHDVNLILGEGLTLTIAKSGETVRVTDERNVVDTVNVDGHPVEIRRVSYGEAYLINRDGDRRPLPDKRGRHGHACFGFGWDWASCSRSHGLLDRGWLGA